MFRLSPETVRVVAADATLVVVMPLANVGLTNRWIVNPVTLAGFAVQLRLTVRLLPFPFGPLTAVNAVGAVGMIGMTAEATLVYADWTNKLIAVTRYEYVIAVAAGNGCGVRIRHRGIAVHARTNRCQDRVGHAVGGPLHVEAGLVVRVVTPRQIDLAAAP